MGLMEAHNEKKEYHSFEKGGSLHFELIYARMYTASILSTSQA